MDLQMDEKEQPFFQTAEQTIHHVVRCLRIAHEHVVVYGVLGARVLQFALPR